MDLTKLPTGISAKYVNDKLMGLSVYIGNNKTKYFSLSMYGNVKTCLEKAIEFRDKKIEEGSIKPRSLMTITDEQYVYKLLDKEKNHVGYIVSINRNYRKKHKNFSFYKFGDNAFEEAVKFRDNYLLNDTGVITRKRDFKKTTRKRFRNLPTGVTLQKSVFGKHTYLTYRVYCGIGNKTKCIDFNIGNVNELTLANVRIARKKAIRCRADFLRYKAFGMPFIKTNKDY